MSNKRGIALLITLTVIAILITTVLELNRKMRASVTTTAANRDKVALSFMVNSGIDAACAMLIKDKGESRADSYQEDWANPEKTSELLAEIPFPKGKVRFIIIDEMSKIQVNALVKFPKGRNFDDPQRVLWDKFIRLALSSNKKFEDIEPNTIINSAKDWLDSGDDDAITGLSGAESEYYEDLEPPYPCRNGPIPHLDELALIKGVDPELYSGIKGRGGISNYLTVYGKKPMGQGKISYTGKININTAEIPVLMALLPYEQPELAQDIYKWRLEKEGDTYLHSLTSSTWYKEVPGCSDINIDSRLINVSSDIYRIVSTAALNDMKMTAEAVVKREKNKKTGKWVCRILNFYIKS